MLNRLKTFETNFSVSKATIIVGVFSLLSRIVGLLRDRLFASRFGAGDTLDVYYAAFRIPDFIFNLLILGTLSVAFIPVFTELLIADRQKAYKVASSVLNFSFLVMAFICLGLMVFAEPLTHLLVPGFSGQKFADTVTLTRIFLLSPIIFTLSSIFSSILNSQKKFLVANIAPIMYNLGIIFGLIILYPNLGLAGLGYGVILGALLHLAVQIPEAVRYGYSWSFEINLKDNSIKKIFKLFLPRILGVENSQISLLIGSIVGSILASGSIAIFNLANNLQAVPLGVFAISTAVAVFPLLSEFYAGKKEQDFASSLNKAMVQIIFFMVPFTILLLLFRAHIVRLVFGAGKFNWQDTILTFNTLGLFSLSLFAQGLTPLLARAFYARQDTKTPVFCSIITMALNAALTYYFGIKFGVVGMAAGFSIASIFNALILYLILRSKIAEAIGTASLLLRDKYLFTETVKIIGASLFMGLAGYATLYIIAPLVNTHTVIGLLIQLTLAFFISMTVFIIAGKLLKIPQTSHILKGRLGSR